MEIRIKTAEEFRDSHVTIEIVARDVEEAADVASSVRNHQRVIESRNEELEKERQVIEKALTVLSTEDVVQAQRMCMGALEQRMATAIREARKILLGQA